MAERKRNRIAFTVQYDGSEFHGWQLQPQHRSVQSELERAASRLFDRPTRVIGSGRTDRGVHSLGQVAIVDAPVTWSPMEFKRAMNAILPADVRLTDPAEVADDFHPRFAALERSYLYRVGVAEAAESPFHARWCWALERAPRMSPMEAATAAIVGDHSFLAFAKAGQEHRGDRCIVFRAGWSEWECMGLEFRITANRFLHRMVRYLVGTLVEIGQGRRPAEDLARLLAGDPALTTSPPAPSRGLFLTRVVYPQGAYPARDLDTAIASGPRATDRVDR